MLPSEIANLKEDEALEDNRPPDVARYYGLLAALDAVYLNANHATEMAQEIAIRLGYTPTDILRAEELRGKR